MTITPTDILADGVDTTEIAGKTIRKGTIAAFLANIDAFSNSESSPQEKADALTMLQQLAPDIIAIGLTKHVEFKDPVVRKILSEID